MKKQNVQRLERGWSGHSIVARTCRFRRNTLLTLGDVRIVVSTIGENFPTGSIIMDTVGHLRDYETRIFHAKKEGNYLEADVCREINADGCEWSLYREDARCSNVDAHDNMSNAANAMHEATVDFVISEMERGAVTNKTFEIKQAIKNTRSKSK